MFVDGVVAHDFAEPYEEGLYVLDVCRDDAVPLRRRRSLPLVDEPLRVEDLEVALLTLKALVDALGEHAEEPRRCEQHPGSFKPKVNLDI